MDLTRMTNKLASGVKRYKFVLLVVLVGLALMMIPSGGGEEEVISQVQEENQDISARLAHILSQIQGAGQVQVLLTESAGEMTVYQTDRDEGGGSDGALRADTVIVTDSNRAQSGLVQQILPPKYQGAIIVCQGGDSPAVRLAIVEAVCKVTGLGADRVSVLKMK